MEIIKAGTKIVIGMNAGMCGTDAMEGYILSSDYTSDELDDLAWSCGLEHASMYGVYPECDRPEEEEEDEINGDEYSDGIEGWWAIYAEKYEGHITFGNESPTFREI